MSFKKLRLNTKGNLKTSILLTLFLSCLMNVCQAQEVNPIKFRQSFIELNLGIALIQINDEHDQTAVFLPYPGASFLLGQTIVYENNAIFEYQAGIAAPSIFTGKIGMGKQINGHNYVFGLRPYPFTLYSQMTFASKKKGSWIISLEYNPLRMSSALSFSSRANFNIGYRWNLNTKKSKSRKHR